MYCVFSFCDVYRMTDRELQEKMVERLAGIEEGVACILFIVAWIGFLLIFGAIILVIINLCTYG